MVKAIIYKPSKTSTQSGRQNTKNWVLTYTPSPQKADSLMGWIGSGSTMNQLKLKFSSKENAINYAIQNGLLFEIREPHLSSFKEKSYAENFTIPK
ncbi:MAG: ETC complex I subunit [Alphaproteobacteria bacterium]|jgi:hypothetical protein|nr:ETC complex I subunit [Alphaproteobacteria bacterium]MDP3533179.1 ETC complex I subunit [Alphaproteobacteria bacterium]